jgi:ABC-type nitrate/sulfonate/bicarbonate transport system substrate-binding protein
MTTIKIAGVPEHFNHPWQRAIKRGAFAAKGIGLQWTNVPEGTGRLCQMLRAGEADMAVILTEGIVKDILAGNPSKIVQVYVETPLLWGIHVAAGSPFGELSQLKGKTVAISRPGSGSELMAYVNAENQNWPLEGLRFEIVHTLDGAVSALTEGRADYFMWERFMTKPLVDRGIFRRIADCPTPWPSFVIAASDGLIAENPEKLKTVLDTINAETAGFREVDGIPMEIAEAFHQKEDDVKAWLALTRWSSQSPGAEMLNKVQNELANLGLTDKKGTFDTLAYRF